MNKTYEERVRLKTVYDLMSVFGLILIVTGVVLFFGVVGHSDVEFVIPSVKIWSVWDYLFYSLISLVIGFAGNCFYRLGIYGSYVQDKVLRKMEKLDLW